MADEGSTPPAGLPLVIRNTFWELKEDAREGPDDQGARKFYTAPPGGNSSLAAAAEPIRIEQLGCISEEQGEILDDVSRSVTGNAAETEVDDSLKTTAMLRNLPPSLARDEVLALIDGEGFFGKYDFFYLPMDFATMSSFGYCFINLESPEVAQRFWAHFDGFRAFPEPTESVLTVSWSAKHQGLDSNVERYRNCPVMYDRLADECRPVLLKHGVRVPFPPPTKKLRQPRVRVKKEKDAAGNAAEGAGAAAAATGDGSPWQGPGGPLMRGPASTEPAYV